MQLKIISILLGLLLLTARILVIVLKPNVLIDYPVALIGIGGYLFAVGLASMLLEKMYYHDTLAASAQRNKFIRMVEIFSYSIMVIVIIVTILLCFTVLK